jgi:hypothetical protein
MYLVSWIEEEGKVEASLGGRVTVEEMQVFAEELRGVVATFDERPYVLTIDHSKAKPFDAPTQRLLTNLKDHCLDTGAERIVSVVLDEDAMAQLTSERLMPVLEGKEQIVMAAEEEWFGAEAIELPFELRRAA